MCFTTYFKNFILCSELDYYCLLCDEIFENVEEIDRHIRWEQHRKKLKVQSVLPQLKNDGIYKVENYFYCIHCNHVSFNFKSIKAHVAESRHTSCKTSPNSHPDKNNNIDVSYDGHMDVVVINNITIDYSDWNGIVRGKCLLCDITVKNNESHDVDPDHVIRIIQSKTEIVENECYRKINETTVQCFKCMQLFTPEDWGKHCKRHKIDLNSPSEQAVRVSQEEYEEICKAQFDIKKYANIPDLDFKIDLIKKEVICNHCMKTVRNSYEDMRQHMKQHGQFKLSNITEKVLEEIEKRYVFCIENDSGKKRHELAVFGKKNYIKLDAGGKRGYCTLCDRFLCCSMNIFREHVEGTTHTGHLELKGLIKQKKQRKNHTGPKKNFASYVKTIEYLFDLENIVVNNNLCIYKDSFLLLKRIKHGRHFRMTKCLVCEETFKWWKEKEHCETSTHRSYVMGAKVVCGNLTFVREIKPNLYHCGVCNVTLPYWESLEKHVRDMTHKTYTMFHTISNILKSYKGQGVLPAHDKIQISNVNHTLYSNLMNMLFKSPLGFHIYSVNLDKESPRNKVK